MRNWVEISTGERVLDLPVWSGHHMRAASSLRAQWTVERSFWLITALMRVLSSLTIGELVSVLLSPDEATRPGCWSCAEPAHANPERRVAVWQLSTQPAGEDGLHDMSSRERPDLGRTWYECVKNVGSFYFSHERKHNQLISLSLSDGQQAPPSDKVMHTFRSTEAFSAEANVSHSEMIMMMNCEKCVFRG